MTEVLQGPYKGGPFGPVLRFDTPVHPFRWGIVVSPGEESKRRLELSMDNPCVLVFRKTVFWLDFSEFDKIQVISLSRVVVLCSELRSFISNRRIYHRRQK